MRVFTMLPMRHWREAAPFAAAAEAAGFDALMTVELGHDVFTPLAFAALATERIELTPSIAVAFPRSPTIMASQAWDLQANSNGRFVLGLGSQVKGHNERRFGIPWSPPAPRLRDYVRALRARNAALRSAAADVEASFRIPLSRAGARLVSRRRDLVLELAPRVAQAYAAISGSSAPQAQIAYRTAAGLRAEGPEEDLALRLADILAARVERDRERGFTSAGPHMDDLQLTLDAHGARPFASQGQQRALVLALKIGEIENLRAALGAPPLLLLDDVSSELDPSKNRYLLEYLAHLPGQALMTTTDRRLLASAAGPEDAFYKVEQGAVTRIV
jgi:alkanesulfonate monooxygenase SsuD/methylene tetrahydromethanopterin reductase-like flavin-dependent oxidoreductase (luciferase family)